MKPQVAYMMIALTLFSDYPKEERMLVRDYYNAISNFTQAYTAMVTLPQRKSRFAETDDSLISPTQLFPPIVKYVLRKQELVLQALELLDPTPKVTLHIQALFRNYS